MMYLINPALTNFLHNQIALTENTPLISVFNNEIYMDMLNLTFYEELV